MADAVAAVDVGSTSARAGIFDPAGRMLGSASVPFSVNRPAADHAEHDSGEIWAAVAKATHEALSESGAAPAAVKGLAFDATCSLVMLDSGGRPVTVSTTGEDRWNVVMWADHRATREATEITGTRHRALDYVGGTMSPEMELPKLLWLKRNLPRAWSRYGLAFDLADFLTWRATGVPAASACTVTCKWTYLNHQKTAWQVDLLDQIGLSDMLSRLRLPQRAMQLGMTVGGLTAPAAADLGLPSGIPVGVGLIDAHAGGLGVLAGASGEELNQRLAVIAGTSTCHMAISPEPRAVPGIWGPYFGAMLPGLWLNEGGQSAAGALLDHILEWHVEGRKLGANPHERLGQYIMQKRAEAGPGYAREVLVLPDFHGNRSPLAVASLRGVIHGLDLDTSLDSLARLYHAAVVGLGYGTRHIIDELNRHGYRISRLNLTGGHSKSALLMQLYADATGCEIALPREADGVLLGTSLAAATAAGLYPDLQAAGRAMVHQSRVVRPDPEAGDVHTRGYAAFRLMIEQRKDVTSVLARGSH